ncbi:YccF domain-containing protein [Pleomorphomonas sp. PLEO]|uniref:YccF domain-containing protein n=1 Tax=Pleomorphomonas sp. PLEO TaxID=3239306 RepID=UPI00351ED940
MHFAGCLLWCALGGGWTALFWLIGAAVFSLTTFGRPLARAAIEMAGLSLSPFGRDAVHIRDLGGQDPVPTTAIASVLGFFLNPLWMLTFGLPLCAAYLVIGIFCYLTVRGRSLGLQCFRMAYLSLWPVGRRVISTDLATVPCQQAAVERFARVQLRKASQNERTDRPTSAPSTSAR